MNKLYGQQEFNKMIMNEKNMSHYLISGPFSTVNNANYGNTLTPELFEKEFLVYNSLRSIENDIFSYLDDISQNTVLITGYQGCGKTTFVNYLARNLQKHYIKKGKRSNIEIIDFEELDDEENDGGEQNLFRYILVKKIVDEINISPVNVIKVFANGFYSNIELFKNIGNRMYMQLLFKFIKNNAGIDFNDNPQLEIELYNLLNKLSIVQLLVVWSYFIICKRYCQNTRDFVEIIIFDNVDDIYNDKFTESFIRGLKKYHEIGSRFVANIKLETNTVRFNIYSNFNFIFCLRDTSTAKFSYHFATRAVEFFHKDISERVDKKIVMDNKIKYLRNNGNDELKRKSEIIDCICNDNYTINRIFPFYNNDYRTATKSLCDVLEKNQLHSQEYYEMTYNQDNPAFHFGAHGIILKLILDSFERQGYFRSIGSYKVTYENEDSFDKKGDLDCQNAKSGNDVVDYSIPRIILTYLYNYQDKHKDNFMNNLPTSTISMRQIYDDFYKIINPNNIAEKLVAMYVLHESKDWNHLVNINATYTIDSANLKDIFNRYSNGYSSNIKDGRIQITCAGRVFIRMITTHFEYFSCRYFKNSLPLFMDENLIKSDSIYKFDILISNTFEKVCECCKKAYNFDMDIQDIYFKSNKGEFMGSHYLYKQQQTHVERILNHNISYIDAYRQYIIQRSKDIQDVQGKRKLTKVEEVIDSDKKNICKLILGHIDNYLSQIKKYIELGYVSQNTIDLYNNQYMVGRDKIGTNYLSEEIISFKMDRHLK